MNTLTVTLKRPHPKQAEFISSTAKRKVIRAGRRGGKTTGISIFAVQCFLDNRRVLYGAPTEDQVAKFWYEVKSALSEPLDAGVFYKNETKHIIERSNTTNRLRAKTAWNADTLRGDYADVLILDEFQLMNEETWGVVGAPMLADNNGDAVFIYTPPSLNSRSTTKANDPQHAAKMFKMAKADTTGRWATFHFSSYDNPHVSKDALDDLASDMTALSYRMEILAEDVDESPGALWKRDELDAHRHKTALPDLTRIAVAIDPSATSTGDEAGIITGGIAADKHGYVLADDSVQGSPKTWATAAITAFYRHHADLIVAEANNGGEMIVEVIRAIDRNIRVKLVHASRGKQTRAEPIAAHYEQGRCHHVGTFNKLEDEMCLWTPGDASPNRMDALVWLFTELMLKPEVGETKVYSSNPFSDEM